MRGVGFARWGLRGGGCEVYRIMSYQVCLSQVLKIQDNKFFSSQSESRETTDDRRQTTERRERRRETTEKKETPWDSITSTPSSPSHHHHSLFPVTSLFPSPSQKKSEKCTFFHLKSSLFRDFFSPTERALSFLQVLRRCDNIPCLPPSASQEVFFGHVEGSTLQDRRQRTYS
ncbi:LANO_0A03554g1_1 [Lachancea nothofagi CBS 11611]|uniref:LANO_0A03554g1_1 n=1 Tax=Lachancea nothofagi CBS 11611 TaxID=1266666 RepID=A0A1G4IPK1_9SACH|nr:LANO_0A03554g1_1 [Lachancea nothofagi CBS 11611]